MLETAGDVSAAAAALAGLVLVFFGSSIASLDSYSTEQRGSVQVQQPPSALRQYPHPAQGMALTLMAEAACLWGERSFSPRDPGGRPQRFCRPSCRTPVLRRCPPLGGRRCPGRARKT
jgi:hypothetical protein